MGNETDTQRSRLSLPSPDNFDFRWLGISAVTITLWIIFSGKGHCQSYAVSNPGEYTALAAGNILLNKTVKKEMEAERETALLQTAMSGEFTKIKQWESKYNSYLKTADGYASSLKAATSIYDDGVRILLYLGKIRKSCADNPQGIAATVAMNDLYAETVSDFVSVFSILKNSVAKGGSENMLTGSERSRTLWELEDRLKSLSDKLKLLHYSIRHYRMADVWNQATAGMIDRDKAEIASQSLSHWKRYASEVAQYSR